ncbi:MAG: hypothetical protein WCR55_11360 [Lentisphaerota bacterium]
MKKIFILICLIAISFLAYYGYKHFIKERVLGDYSQQNDIRDQALHNLTLNQGDDIYNSAFYLTAKWTSELETNPNNSSVKMEVIATKTESAKGKKVIALSSMKGITPKGTKEGSLMCHVFRKDITQDSPFVWVRISATIDGQPQSPIIKALGKFN